MNGTDRPHDRSTGSADAAALDAALHGQALEESKREALKHGGVPKKKETEEEAEARKEKERKERLLAARRTRRRGLYKPLKFVAMALGVWWVVSLLGDLVITCVPGGVACHLPNVVWSIQNPSSFINRSPNNDAVTLSNYEWPLLLVTLLAAVWVAKAKVYPPGDDAGEFTEDQLDGKLKEETPK